MKWLRLNELRTLQVNPSLSSCRLRYRGGFSFVEVDEMSRAKGKAVKKQVSASALFKIGQRVKVVGGEFGNARGTVEGAGREGVAVLLDNAVRQGTVLFTAAQLVAINVRPARR